MTPGLVPDIAARRADLSPDAVAFVDHGTGETWTFSAVDRAARTLGAALLAQGLEEGDRVAILCLNRAEFFVALFACLKTGLILCPLNWRAPLPELSALAQSVACRAVIHDAAHTGMATGLNLPTVPMAGVGYDLPAATLPARDVDDRAPWYLLFTSGTTGTPKAVIQTPRMMLGCALNIAQSTGMTGADSGACYLPLFHTAGINLYTLPLFLWGGTSHILPKFDADTLLNLIAAGKITQFFGVPAIYQAFRLHPAIDAVNLAALRGYGCGGAALSADVIRFFSDRGAVICAGFGMTETGPTGFLIDRAAALTRIGSVGKPQIMTEARLAGVPNGTAGEGEVQMRGATVTPGYFGNPEATRDAFTADGWLRSGDIARRDAEGFYTIIDRIKDMFISGGENVYPAEVERVLLTHPAILEVAVIGMPDPVWGEVGRAHVIPQPGAVLDVATLPDWCRARLAAFKVPRSFHLCADFPRTAAGKVRKTDLRGAP